ncbi:hypothetical protein Ccrd_003556 [Cynara cardunculus var. scolymus]|uniref:Bifunctional inhibitor/plant lipid transfer protein/seed storage helical domain-containing protein n=1 Tax=Cynara cardunculus var. scolymus TaxID=59895 RepID=A0A103XP65_CYNCS|nr:hypothetical protein Ccrd_003556 [Cynara cardunculus var. scolymus]
MATKKFEAFGLIMVMLWGIAMAQSGCTTALVSLSPCLSYVSGNSSAPSSTCCSQLANVVVSQPQCLCPFTGNGGGSPMGLNINQTLALALPGACNIVTPPISRCDESGTKTTPGTSVGTSGGATKNLPFYATFVLFFVATFSSYYIA